MKELLGWLRWTWGNQETWQRWWIVGTFFIGAAVVSDGLIQKILWAVPVTIFVIYITKWCLWDAFWSSWAKYKQHRNELLSTIKNSDQ